MITKAPSPKKADIDKEIGPLFELCRKITDRNEHVKPFADIEEFHNFLIGSGARVWKQYDEQKKMVGFLAIVAMKKDNSMEVLMVGVDPDIQSKGHGRRLMALAEQFANENGIKRIFLFTTKTNEKAIKFYERLGYVRISEVENHYDDGKARYLFEKML